MKRCTKCGEWKEFGEYHKVGKGSSGLAARCKACVAEYQMKYREANKEKCAEYQMKYREANKERVAESHRKYREANKERIAESHRKYREANKEKCAEYVSNWMKENREKFLEYKRRYKEKISQEKRFMETMNAISELSNKKEG